jgi:alkyldihydroxyacetonephosphate synthase
MLRLSDALETETTLVLAGHERLIGLAERALSALGLGEDKCLLLFGLTGGRKLVGRARDDLIEIARAHDGRHVGTYMGGKWRDSRFLSPYLRNSLWEVGYAVDTLETALPWSAIPETVEQVKAVIRSGLQARGERVHAFSHLSHIYTHGASFYVTYLFRIPTDPARQDVTDHEEMLRRWRTLKDAASQAIVAAGGTISHQHGVGIDHLPYMVAEKGALGIKVLEDVQRTFDPRRLLNPGKLLSES